MRKYIALAFVILLMLGSVFLMPSREERVEELKQQYELPAPVEVLPPAVVDEPEPEPEPAEEIEAEYVEENENELIEQALLAKATMIEDCKITYYCCEQYPHICNAGPPYLTYLETVPTPWVTCAVDPRVIPLGSTVLIDFGDGELLYLVAEDIGGSIKGHKIDVNVALHDEALELGVDYATVYYIPPEVNCNG